MSALMYKNPFIYNILMKFLHSGFKEYEIIADMLDVGSCLDLGCATCLLKKYLDENIDYEGWDLNDKFIKYNFKRGLNVKKKNIFDFKNSENIRDTIIVKDLLHHVFPRDQELLGLLKKHAKEIIVCEPILKKTRLKDQIFEPKIFGFLHKSFGDSDGINEYFSGKDFQRAYTRDSFLEMLEKFGKIKHVHECKEMIIIKLCTQ